MVRRTRQGEAIRGAFLAADRPLAPQEVCDEAREAVPRIGRATVYRNIRSLVAEGWLRVVLLPGAPDRYEVAGKGHHHHFHCRRCDGVFEVEACPGDLDELVPGGFRLEEHDLTLRGLCSSCVP